MPPNHARPVLPGGPGLRFETIVCYYNSQCLFLLFTRSFLLLWKPNSLITGNKHLIFSHVTLQHVKYQMVISLDRRQISISLAYRFAFRIKQLMGAGKTAQWLRILAAPPEDQSLVLSIHISGLQQLVTPAVEDLTPPSLPPQEPTHIYT